MQQLPCPKCSTPIPVRVETADDRGRVRLACPACNARLLIKVNPRTLSISPNIPQVQEPPPEPLPIHLTAEQLAVWAVVVHGIEAEHIGEARRALLTMPRFRSNPNKLHDATDQLPFVIGGLHRTEAARLEEQFDTLTADFESGPQAWLLDDDLKPIPPSARGSLPDLDRGWTDEFDPLHGESNDLDVSFDLAEARSGDDLWPSYAAEQPDEGELAEIEDDALDLLTPAVTDPAGTPSATEPALSITNEVAVEDFDEYDFDEEYSPSGEFFTAGGGTAISTTALPDTEESAAEDGSTSRPAMPVVTIDRIPGMDVVLGGVQTRIALTSTLIGANPDDVIGAALDDGQRRLRKQAAALGAGGVVGLHTSHSAVPGPSGWLWILILSGTAVRP